MGYSDPPMEPMEGEGGSEHPISVLSRVAACDLLVMLTPAVLMTSSRSEGQLVVSKLAPGY